MDQNPPQPTSTPDSNEIIITDPYSGVRYRARNVPPGMNRDQVEQEYQKRHARPQNWNAPPQAKPETDQGSTGSNLAKGALQGAVLNIPEGFGQLHQLIAGRPMLGAETIGKGFEYITGKTPEKYRHDVESTTAGKVGEVGGEIGSMVVGGLGAAGQAARSIPAFMRAKNIFNLPTAALKGSTKVLREAGNKATLGRVQREAFAKNNPVASAAVSGGISGGLQPTPEGQNPYLAKAGQIVGGAAGSAVLGGAAPRILQAAADHLAARSPWHAASLWSLINHPQYMLPAAVTLESLAMVLRSQGGKKLLDDIVKLGGTRAAKGALGVAGGNVGAGAEGAWEDTPAGRKFLGE